MGVITNIIASRNQEGRYEIHVDGAPLATVSAETIGRLGLRTRLALSEEIKEEIKRDAAALATFDRAVVLLSFRSRSVWELRKRLLQKGEPEDLVDLAIERLLKLGLLNDASYARQYTRSKLNGAGHGRRRLAYDLQKRGVAKEVAGKAIQEVIDQDQIDEEAILEKVAEKKLRSLARFDEETKRRRLYGFLARRGFGGEEISRVMSHLFKESSGP